jgi:hypothetical protein
MSAMRSKSQLLTGYLEALMLSVLGPRMASGDQADS